MPGTPEIEWQFDVTDFDPIQVWLDAQAKRFGLTLHSQGTVSQVDVYFDTADWRFHRASTALRVRRRGATVESTLKTFGLVEGGARHRHEISEAIRAPARASAAVLAGRLSALPGPVGERIRAVAPDLPLARLFEARVERRVFLVKSAGMDIVEIAFDTVQVVGDPKRAPLALLRLEVEAKTADAGALETFVAALRDECSLAPANASKFELGLKMGGLHPGHAPYLGAPATEAELVALAGAAPSIGLLAYTVMRERFGQFIANEPGARMGDDVEFVHDMRVATRRLRAAMGLFEPFLPRRAQALREELRWIAGALGAVRDLDVQIEHLTHAMPDPAGQPAQFQAYEGILSVLRGQHLAARRLLLEALNSERYARLEGGFEELLRAGPHKAAIAVRPAPKVLPGLILDRYRKARKAGDDLDENSPPTSYHALRIRVKRLRYALEFSHPVFRAAVDEYLPNVLALQDILGGYQDAEVAIAHMRALSMSNEAFISPSMVFTLGEMSQQRAEQAEALRAQFPAAWSKITGKEWKRLRAGLA
ncbi:MAG: CHAD domain-containing protein [Thermoflexales bacterium]